MIKNKKLLLIIFIIFLFGVTSFVSAIEVPDGPCADAKDLGACAVNIFKWGINIAAIIAALSFAVGAITLMVSGDNASRASSGKDRMKGSIYGLVLLGASYVIMTTINLALINPGINPLDPTILPPVQTPPGVYFYSDSSCKESYGGSTTVSLWSIGPNVKGIKIVNDPANNISYGAILHEVDGLDKGGKCSPQPITSTNCQPVNTLNGAIDVWKISRSPSTSGSGVTFYSRPFGLDRGARAGYYTVQTGAIPAMPTTPQSPNMNFEWKGVNVPDEYKNIECPTFQNCPGSIDIKGDYIVAIYSDTNNSYCQTFTKNVTNLNAEPVVASGETMMTKIYIIPTGGATN